MLQERILQTLERRDNLDQRKLSHIANLNESSISRYLNGTEEINFESVLRMVKFLYPEEEKETMVEYIRTQKSRNARHALEYCAMNNCWAEVDELIQLLAKSTNPVDREWASMYELVKMRKEKHLPPIELLQKVEVIKPKEQEMQILKTILKAYLYFDLEEHYSLALHIEGTDALIKDIKSNFIKESFSVRKSLIMTLVYLYANNLEKSRHYCYAIIGQDFFEQYKAMAHNNLGQSYMFEDYQKSKDYFIKALNYFIMFDQKESIQEIKNSLAFLYSYWEIDQEFTLSLDDQSSFLNYIYYLIRKSELTLAQEYLNKIDLNHLSNWDKAFYYYYKALIHQDVSTYYQSVEAFLNVNDYYHLQLPLQELKKLGENEEALKIISLMRGRFHE